MQYYFQYHYNLKFKPTLQCLHILGLCLALFWLHNLGQSTSQWNSKTLHYSWKYYPITYLNICLYWLSWAIILQFGIYHNELPKTCYVIILLTKTDYWIFWCKKRKFLLHFFNVELRRSLHQEKIAKKVHIMRPKCPYGLESFSPDL